MRTLPSCHARIPKLVEEQISALGAAWAISEDRPCISAHMLNASEQLLDEWFSDRVLAIVIRKHNRNRGTVVSSISGRLLVPTDNSPAQWVFSLAYAGECPTKRQLADLLRDDKVPVAMAMSKEEKASAARKCALGQYSVNRKGWKLAHANDIGFRSSRSLGEIPDADLKAHFMAFLSPRNMFVVPSAWAGLAEVESFARHFR
ncbi:MAG: hypothetical protein R3B74_12180 [Nitrospirales bacterium]|nr:hypothetical protein [Nitrospirales bacterium]